MNVGNFYGIIKENLDLIVNEILAARILLYI